MSDKLSPLSVTDLSRWRAMLSLAAYAKTHLTQLPYPIGVLIARVPFSLRPGIGKRYRTYRQELQAVRNASTEQTRQFVFTRVKQLAEYAYANVPFYREKYQLAGIDPSRFTAFSDLNRLPVIDKEELQTIPLQDRSAPRRGRYLVNTGGSSGQPLEFYVESNSIPHEWAHMHEIWSRVNYRQGDLRIVFGGRANITRSIQYDSARHQWNVDIQRGWHHVADQLVPLLNRRTVRFLHGYPSAIFDFVLWAESNSHPVLRILRNSIGALLLGSEYPPLRIREDVETALSANSVSWYGHTERAVLAGEVSIRGEYRPFLSYGYAEAVEMEQGTALVATSYYNYASPLIRYSTDDVIEPDTDGNFLRAFTITQGRQGDYILDRALNKVFLTGLIFGRHHRLFSLVRHMQVRQDVPGHAVVLVVPRGQLTPEEAGDAFDATNVDVSFAFRVIERPVRTQAGKAPLLVS